MSSQSRKINLRVPKAVSIFCLIALAGCAGPPVVPVSDLSATQSSGSIRIVRAGDSLYTISWEAGLDYRDVALWNGLQPPYALTVGQKIELSPGRINAQNTIVTPAASYATSILVVGDEPAEASETLTDPDAQENEQENERGRAADNDWASTRQFALRAPSEKSRSFHERPRPVKSQNLASSRLTAKRMSDAASTQAPTHGH